mmetsp:Transcript_100511/g.197303  ORF Transcript_100511/g.197303 Transcript_100511/m.197303 type:complete len:215 (-) Transcript_100511:2241-2885(-)
MVKCLMCLQMMSKTTIAKKMTAKSQRKRWVTPMPKILLMRNNGTIKKKRAQRMEEIRRRKSSKKILRCKAMRLKAKCTLKKMTMKATTRISLMTKKVKKKHPKRVKMLTKTTTKALATIKKMIELTKTRKKITLKNPWVLMCETTKSPSPRKGKMRKWAKKWSLKKGKMIMRRIKRKVRSKKGKMGSLWVAMMMVKKIQMQKMRMEEIYLMICS